MRLTLLAPAEAELREAVDFYERQAVGLGQDLLAEVRAALSAIRETPLLAQPVRGELRRRIIRRFPYAVLYRVDADEIVVLAVMHLRRRPGYWRGRG